jgi:hypothetical protein
MMEHLLDFVHETEHYEVKTAEVVMHMTKLIKHCLCIINETEYVEEDEDGSTSEEEQDDDDMDPSPRR